MKVLAIETATLAGGVALMEEGGLIAEYRLHVEIRHSERLLTAIDRLLVDSGTTLSDLDAIAISIGPGSFTGLRVGLSTAKGLAMGSGKPLVAVPTLEAMAALFPYSSALIVPMLDARRNEVYWGLFDTQGGVPVRIHSETASSPETALATIGPLDRPILAVGEGAERYRALLSTHPPEKVLSPPKTLHFPSAASVAELGLAKLRRGEILSAEEVAPVYLRASTAELKWEEKVSQQGGGV
ncbi:MAG: tRNA (adenosine(37)-N6)-threonylcarbamoyltransferase complex dimerization subunit type 1 TsaB [Nitrospirae bacterium]|nr:tRNA (adenosine(37)-N6)-threonylcarbamoyltransferase complex dimerization subunit type 1 TsaB [Candidatus Manganitrophaceae bacterium]